MLQQTPFVALSAQDENSNMAKQIPSGLLVSSVLQEYSRSKRLQTLSPNSASLSRSIALSQGA